MLSLADVVIGLVAAVVIGLSKTAVPGSGLLATPLIALTFTGRQISGATIVLLLIADVFAVRFYRQHARWDVLRGLAPWVVVGFAAGAWFYVSVGSRTRTIDVVIAVMILVIVVLQAQRLVRRRPATGASRSGAAFYGSTGGFATFVSNNAGPILNSYLMGMGLDKDEFIGTSSWFYFVVNVTKLPIYVVLGAWSHRGGHFFTHRSLLFDLAALPGVLAGLWIGRRLYRRIDQRTFIVVVLGLSAAGAVKLLIG